MIKLNGRLSVEQVEKVVIEGEAVELALESKERIEASYQFLEQFHTDKIIYGINTGFGPMAQYRVDDAHMRELQFNIIRSHSVGAGKPLSELDVRALMLARLNSMLQGSSGIHPDAARVLVAMLNERITPQIFEHGGVGASGDLVQLAHLGLCMIGEGEVFYEGILRPTAEVFKQKAIEPLGIHIREGLSITNGTSCMTGIGLVNLLNAKRLLRWSILASCLVNEIASSYDDGFSVELNEVKLHEGQQEVARLMREGLSGSTCVRDRVKEMYAIARNEKQFDENQKIQPYYSLRCVPQILGPVIDTLQYTERVLVNELNSVSDNPIVDAERRNVYHGGNFHGDYVSLEMDKLKIALTKSVMLAERQLSYLLHDRINGILPPFVNLGTLGLNYGMQAAQFTATSTTAECQTLAYPMYVHSIPNNNENQDVVSMGTNAALLTAKVVESAYQVMAIHFMAIAQAVDCLNVQAKLAPKTRAVYDDIRNLFPRFSDDSPMYKDVATIVSYLKQGSTTY